MDKLTKTFGAVLVLCIFKTNSNVHLAAPLSLGIPVHGHNLRLNLQIFMNSLKILNFLLKELLRAEITGCKKLQEWNHSFPAAVMQYHICSCFYAILHPSSYITRLKDMAEIILKHFVLHLSCHVIRVTSWRTGVNNEKCGLQWASICQVLRMEWSGEIHLC